MEENGTITDERRRALIVELDFAAANGAELLFDTAKAVLAKHGIDLSHKLEAGYLAGFSYTTGVTTLAKALEKEVTVGDITSELSESFKEALNKVVPSTVGDGLKELAAALAEKGVYTVLDTRADAETVKAAFAGNDKVFVCEELSTSYGSLKIEAWKRICNTYSICAPMSVALTGSGISVRSALIAGLSAVCVENPHVAYQDFSGADLVTDSISRDLAPDILRLMKV